MVMSELVPWCIYIYKIKKESFIKVCSDSGKQQDLRTNLQLGDGKKLKYSPPPNPGRATWRKINQKKNFSRGPGATQGRDLTRYGLAFFRDSTAAAGPCVFRGRRLPHTSGAEYNR